MVGKVSSGFSVLGGCSGISDLGELSGVPLPNGLLGPKISSANSRGLLYS